MISSISPPYLLDDQINMTTEEIRAFSPVYYVKRLNTSTEAYMYKYMPHYEWNRIIGFN